MCYFSTTFRFGNEMILHSAELNTNEITGPSIKAFMDDITNCRIQITHGTTGEPHTGTIQIGCDENKTFKIPFSINNGN